MAGESPPHFVWRSFRGQSFVRALEDTTPTDSTCRVTRTPLLGAAVFVLQGVLNTMTARDVCAMLAGAGGESTVLLDLNGVDSIDFEGMEMLREVIRSVHIQGGRVAISRPWRLSRSISGLIGTEGLVLLSLSPAGAVAWFDRHPYDQTATTPGAAGDAQPQTVQFGSR
jgi:ABC-type transporter Mla MlaB component